MGLPNPRQEADLLVSRVIKTNRLALYLNLGDLVSAETFKKARQFFTQRAAGTPLQYLLGQQEFWGLEFRVTPDVFIPRPETETLVEEVIQLAKGEPKMNIRTLVDVGTGSGCLAIVLSKALPETRILATDLSARALTVARRNARRLGVDRQITFLHGDLFEPLKKRGLGPVDLIVSNPPYIASGELQTLAPEVKDHEPRMALDGGTDGLDRCRRIILESADQLHSGGALVMEIGWKQAAPLKEWINHKGLDWALEFKKDLNGINRVVILKKK